jgi:hypothetical protein
MKTYSGMKLQLSSFLTSALDGVSGLLHNQAAVPLEKETPAPTQQS